MVDENKFCENNTLLCFVMVFAVISITFFIKLYSFFFHWTRKREMQILWRSYVMCARERTNGM